MIDASALLPIFILIAGFIFNLALFQRLLTDRVNDLYTDLRKLTSAQWSDKRELERQQWTRKGEFRDPDPQHRQRAPRRHLADPPRATRGARRGH